MGYTLHEFIFAAKSSTNGWCEVGDIDESNAKVEISVVKSGGKRRKY